MPSKQAYVLENGTVASCRCRYEYVGQGNGDYIQHKYPIKEKNFTENLLYIKDVSSSNISNLIDVICMCYDSNLSEFTYVIKDMLGLDKAQSSTADEIRQHLESSYSKDIIDLYQQLYAIANNSDEDIPITILERMKIN